MKKILLVEDDADLFSLIQYNLEKEGFQFVGSQTGKGAVELCRREKPDLVILDIMLPDSDGLDICKGIRRDPDLAAVPVIFLTARASETDRIVGLEIGANDYVVKPFGTRELLARIRALLRRSSNEDAKVLAFADVEVDLTRRVVKKKGEELKLTRAEYNLLTFFLQNPDRALTRDMILNSVWGYESFPNTRTVDAHVVRLRQKLEPDQSVPHHFLTVHGVGYRFLP